MGQQRARTRIVSLVPSLTETLVHFGLLESLVGRTRYCVEPAGTIERVEAVGGTKNPQISRIVALRPDLVVLNEEENRIEDWRALVGAGLEVLVTHPRTVAEAAEMIEELGRRAGAPEEGAKLAAECRAALAGATGQRAGRRPLRTFCPIWRNPWMTFRAATYIGNVLETVGLKNIFADGAGPTAMADSTRSRQTPNDSASVPSTPTDVEPSDFFEISIDDALACEPEIIVLPDEPYVFGRKHGEELRARGAKAEIFYVDGKDLSWYGPRIPGALERLLKITEEISRT